jgi:hypothetical protein
MGRGALALALLLLLLIQGVAAYGSIALLMEEPYGKFARLIRLAMRQCI